MSEIDKALRIAVEEYDGRADKNGEAMILHYLEVGMMGHTDEERMTGFLIGTQICSTELQERGVPTGVVKAVGVLQIKSEKTIYDHAIDVIKNSNPIALQVLYNELRWQTKYALPEEKEEAMLALEKVKAAIEDCSRIELYRQSESNAVACFAGGCFWGVQHEFEKEDGVVRTLVGYTGGEEELPSYAEVRDHKTHHVEAVIVEYNPEKVGYEQLCKVFFEMHDPSQTDGVGPDLGPQYRSCIFFASPEQKKTAMEVMDILRSKGDEVNTLLYPLGHFWIGEEYHQKYYEKTGGEPYCHFRIKKF